MNISKLSPAEALEAVSAMDTVEELREAATSMNIKFSGNTGEGTLRTKLEDLLSSDLNELEVENHSESQNDAQSEADKEASALDALLNAPDEFPIQEPVKVTRDKGPSVAEMLKMDASKIQDKNLRRQVVRTQALRLVRVKITNVDPNDVQLSGGIITAMNQYTGKVSKYIPYGEESENGYHVPQILLNVLKAQKFALRKEIKGGQFGVKKYKTTMVHKFNIEVLPNLNTEELRNLADHQRASHAIDN